MVGRIRRAITCAMISCFVGTVWADVTIPGADGSDGAFNPAGTTFTVDLSKAVTGTWNQSGGDTDGDGFGDGVYDPEKWAVVFKYESVNVPSGTTVKFTNHPSRAPVVWLVNGDVVITGTVDLSGANGHADGALPTPSESGPGGFRGGTGHYLSTEESGGYGPGGCRISTFSNAYSFGGSYGTQAVGGTSGSAGPAYGNAGILPLIGGSGGGGYMRGTTSNDVDGGAGAGGGAILIACETTITLSGSIKANGGAYTNPASGGSGGAIRIITDLVEGGGTLSATGGSSGGSGPGAVGRIRVEANVDDLVLGGTPNYTTGNPGATATLWPEDDAPSITIVSVGTESVPDDPQADLNYADVSISGSGATTIILESRNVPLDWIVTIRATLLTGTDIPVTATFAGGDETLATWTASITFPNGYSALQARAAKP